MIEIRTKSVTHHTREQVFLASYPFLLICTLAGVGGVCLLIGMINLLTGAMGAAFQNILASWPFGVFYCLAASALMTWLYRVRVTDEGIFGGSFWSTPVFMSWVEMERIEPRMGWFLPCLQIASFRTERSPLWVPRFLANPVGFQKAVEERTSPRHPLRRSLENGAATMNREKLSV